MKNDTDRLLTAEQVAEILGYRNVESVYRLGVSGALPRIVLSARAIRFVASDVRAFIESRREAR